MPQRKFMSDELFSLTLMATAQRGQLFRVGATESERKSFAKLLHQELLSSETAYTDFVSDSDHICRIEKLSERISTQCAPLLHNGRFRIGSAQKALNLHLKYQWCLGRVSMPPHCPIDSIVLAKVPGKRSVRWTKLDSTSEYLSIIDAARKTAGEVPLALWELQLYNNA